MRFHRVLGTCSLEQHMKEKSFTDTQQQKPLDSQTQANAISMPQISEAELEVMKVLWELKSATSPQIVERLTVSTDWKPKTIHTLITRLVAKEAVDANKIDGKSYMYIPIIGEEEYKDHASNSFLKKLYKGSINLMLASFIKEQKLSKTEINDLKKLLDEDGDK